MDKRVTTALGTRVDQMDQKRIKFGRPPLIFESQAFGYIPLDKPEELKQWEEDLRTHHGISIDAANLLGIAAETCTGVSSDACDMEQ